MMKNQINKLCYLLTAKNKKIIVTPYHWPDIDGIASAFALSQFLVSRGNMALAMKWNSPQIQGQWALKKLNLSIPDILYNEQDIVLVDVSDPKDIPDFLPLSKVKTVIDHRLYYDISAFTNLAKEDALIQSVGSASSLVCQICENQNFIPSINSTNMLYLAIMSNTIKCKSHNTTKKDESAIQWLKDKISVNIETVNQMFNQKSKITNIKKSIDDDLSSKLQKINGKDVAVALLQIINVDEFLKANKQQIIQSLEQLKKQRKSQQIFLILLDISKCYTYFVFLNQEIDYDLLQKIRELVPLNNQDYYYFSKDIWLRKEVIAMLQKHQE